MFDILIITIRYNLYHDLLSGIGEAITKVDKVGRRYWTAGMTELQCGGRGGHALENFKNAAAERLNQYLEIKSRGRGNSQWCERVGKRQRDRRSGDDTAPVESRPQWREVVVRHGV